MNLCARCRRKLKSEPVLFEHKGYGPKCAQIMGYVPPPTIKRERPVIQRFRPARRDPRQLDWVQEVAA